MGHVCPLRPDPHARHAVAIAIVYVGFALQKYSKELYPPKIFAFFSKFAVPAMQTRLHSSSCIGMPYCGHFKPF